MPSSGRSAASDASDQLARRIARARADRARRRGTRAAARDPSGARCGHFDDSHDAARMPVRFDARHDEAGAVQRMRDRGRAEARARRSPPTRTESRRTAARARRRDRAAARRSTYAGVARTTARASNASPAAVSHANGPRPRDRVDARRSSRTCVRPAARDERADHLAQAAGQRLERARPADARLRRWLAAEGAQQAAVLPLGLDEPREQRAAPTADRRRRRGCRRAAARRGTSSLRAEAPRHERADRLVRVVAPSAARTARRPSASCRPTRTASCVTNGPTRVGMPSTDAAGSGAGARRAGCRRGAAAWSETSRSPRPSSWHSAIAFGLLDQQRVGAAVDGEAVDLLADDDAAGARARARARRTTRRGASSSYAAASPAMPPPTMTTSTASGVVEWWWSRAGIRDAIDVRMTRRTPTRQPARQPLP